MKDFKYGESYTPPAEIIEKYAKVLINFALGGGKGIKKGDVVMVAGSEASRPLFIAMVKEAWKSGAHVIEDYDMDTYYDEDNLGKFFYENASDEQLDFFKKDYLKGLVKQIDHQVMLIADTNIHALKDVDPAKIMRRRQIFKPFHDWLEKKEDEGKLTWTLGLYGTDALAKEVGLTIQEYWEQIIKACYLDEPDPIAKWKEISKKTKDICKNLNNLPIEWLHITGDDIDLKVKIGSERKWVGGSGRNIPSFEIFTSPDWRGAEGWAKFNQPLYYCDNLIEGIELKFKNGVVVESKATKGEKMLKEMIATKDADKIGEFSLTDSRFSRIDKFMAETLYDENVGGKYGNTHIALGTSYHDTYRGNPLKVKANEWKKMGFNDSSVHTDIVSTTDRTVTATLTDGTEKVIYKNGQFVI